jgi:hypothetical protein
MTKGNSQIFRGKYFTVLTTDLKTNKDVSTIVKQSAPKLGAGRKENGVIT